MKKHYKLFLIILLFIVVIPLSACSMDIRREESNYSSLTIRSEVEISMFVFDVLTDTSYIVSGLKENYININIKNLTIPAQIDGFAVEEIAENAFLNNTFITSVSIPNSVKIINKSAFNGCFNLETVTIGSGSSLTNIASKAFMNCTNLTKILIPQNVSKIGVYAFNGCTNLLKVLLYSPKIYSQTFSTSYGNLLSTLISNKSGSLFLFNGGISNENWKSKVGAYIEYNFELYKFKDNSVCLNVKI